MEKPWQNCTSTRSFLPPFRTMKLPCISFRRTTTVSNYLAEFEVISTRTTGLSHSNLLNCSLSGLKEEIQRELFLLKPQTLHGAMGMAKLVEDKLNANKPSPSRCFPARPPSHPLPLPPHICPVHHQTHQIVIFPFPFVV